ncbi:MAG: SCO family protein [Hyphomicrobiaceae bacterium]|nr:SCO family protein [Hyphomicrobiaceae bacterium]
MLRGLLLNALILGLLACGSALAPAQAAEPFALLDHHGRPFSSTALEGRPRAVFFGFTHCPDVCPTTLLEMSNHLAALGAEAQALAVVFITVDPERDRPETLREYLGSFDPRILGLTGTEAQIKAAAARFGAFYDRIPEGDGTYTVVHSAYVYLIDRRDRAAGTIGFNEPEADQRAKLRALLAPPG